ncbi:MAG: hypothetical protein GC183_14235 [Thiobacillus sp.]|nr:hypothetical protein [Thiobacillus sp.]
MKCRSLFAGAVMLLAASTALAAQEATPEQSQERFAQMHAMMQQADHAATVAERQKLIQEHMKLMQEQMQTMHAMMGQGGMMGRGRMMSGAQKGSGEGSDIAPQMQQMQMMQQRMDMMQQMMEQMMQHQQLMMKPAQ